MEATLKNKEIKFCDFATIWKKPMETNAVYFAFLWILFDGTSVGDFL